MPFFTHPRRAIVPAATLLLAVANAQTCYYPDSRSISTDIPCDPNAPASACCGVNSFCLSDGLCYGGGIVTRGSCTDKTWNSAACAGYCTSEDKSAEIAITPCTSGSGSNTFVCGVNTTDCQSDSNTFTLPSDTSLVLRPSQIAALVGSSLQTPTGSLATATVTAVPSGYYSGGAMAGLAIGIALPLLIALGVVYMLLRRERNKFGHSTQNKKLMYKLPDDLADDLPHTPRSTRSANTANTPRSAHTANTVPSTHTTRSATSPAQDTIRPPPHVPLTAAFQDESNRSSHASATTSMATSPRVSMRTIQTMSSRPVLSRDFPASHSQTFLERYETMKRNAAVQSMEVTPSMMPGSVPGSAPGTPGLGGTSVPGTPSSVPGAFPATPQELDSTEKGEKVRYELSDTRMST